MAPFNFESRSEWGDFLGVVLSERKSANQQKEDTPNKNTTGRFLATSKHIQSILEISSNITFCGKFGNIVGIVYSDMFQMCSGMFQFGWRDIATKHTQNTE